MEQRVLLELITFIRNNGRLPGVHEFQKALQKGMGSDGRAALNTLVADQKVQINSVGYFPTINALRTMPRDVLAPEVTTARRLLPLIVAHYDDHQGNPLLLEGVDLALEPGAMALPFVALMCSAIPVWAGGTDATGGATSITTNAGVWDLDPMVWPLDAQHAVAKPSAPELQWAGPDPDHRELYRALLRGARTGLYSLNDPTLSGVSDFHTLFHELHASKDFQHLLDDAVDVDVRNRASWKAISEEYQALLEKYLALQWTAEFKDVARRMVKRWLAALERLLNATNQAAVTSPTPASWFAGHQSQVQSQSLGGAKKNGKGGSTAEVERDRTSPASVPGGEPPAQGDTRKPAPERAAATGGGGVAARNSGPQAVAQQPTPGVNVLPQADVLLVVVTPGERDAVFAAAKETTGVDQPVEVVHGENRSYHDLGVVGGARVLVVQSEMGTATVGGSLTTILGAMAELRPSTVLMVGIAFGVDPKKQKMGQILVSKQVKQYDISRVGTDKNGAVQFVPRGDKATASPKVLSRLRAAAASFKTPEVNFELILSGEKLVDNIDYRDQLRAFEPEARGGEMEGAGLYIAATERAVGWCIIKAICDFADGNKSRNKKKRQERASKNAAAFALHALSAGGFGRPVAASDGSDSIGDGRSLSTRIHVESPSTNSDIPPLRGTQAPQDRVPLDAGAARREVRLLLARLFEPAEFRSFLKDEGRSDVEMLVKWERSAELVFGDVFDTFAKKGGLFEFLQRVADATPLKAQEVRNIAARLP